jgi:radical SAM superfamily enzyme YgiQ (UPF0313 family)
VIIGTIWSFFEKRLAHWSLGADGKNSRLRDRIPPHLDKLVRGEAEELVVELVPQVQVVDLRLQKAGIIPGKVEAKISKKAATKISKKVETKNQYGKKTGMPKTVASKIPKIS